MLQKSMVAEEILSQLLPEERLRLFKQLSTTMCPECGSITFDVHNGEKSCHECGVVVETAKRVASSFNQEKAGSPSNRVSFGNSNGDTLRKRDLFKVLAQGYTPGGYSFDHATQKGTVIYHPGSKKFTVDLGLRARFVRIYVSTAEHPTVKTLLEIGLRLLRAWNIDSKSSFGISLGNYFATQLRLLGAYFAALNIKPPLHTMADATFALCLKEFGKTAMMNEVLDKQQVDPNLFESVNLFFTITEKLKRRTIQA